MVAFLVQASELAFSAAMVHLLQLDVLPMKFVIIIMELAVQRVPQKQPTKPVQTARRVVITHATRFTLRNFVLMVNSRRNLWTVALKSVATESAVVQIILDPVTRDLVMPLAITKIQGQFVRSQVLLPPEPVKVMPVARVSVKHQP